METGPVQVEPLAGVCAVTCQSVDELRGRKWCVLIHPGDSLAERPWREEKRLLFLTFSSVDGREDRRGRAERGRAGTRLSVDALSGQKHVLTGRSGDGRRLFFLSVGALVSCVTLPRVAADARARRRGVAW